MTSTEHIERARYALRRRYAGGEHWRWRDVPAVEVQPAADDLAAARAHAAVAQVDVLAEVVTELRALREAVTRLAQREPETARRWWLRRSPRVGDAP